MISFAEFYLAVDACHVVWSKSHHKVHVTNAIIELFGAKGAVSFSGRVRYEKACCIEIISLQAF